MSYEGHTEFLCANGHYTSVDCWGTDPTTCGFCSAPITHRHSVDHTNGICYPFKGDDGEIYAASEPQNEGDEPLPETVSAAKDPVGYDDDWRVDHHGNKYAVKIPVYAKTFPWREITP